MRATALSVAAVRALCAVALLAACTSRRPALADAADDAGQGIHTEQQRCVPSPASAERRLDCIVIYRNTTDRPLFDIGIDVAVDGRPATIVPSECCTRGTRQALAAGDSAVFVATVAVPAGVADGAPVAVTYRAASTGDATALDVPKPEIQYVDRSVHEGRASYLMEVRNVDGRTWSTTGEQRARVPVAVYFDRGTIVGVETVARRWPRGRIAADGRAFIGLNPKVSTEAVRVFFREAFQAAPRPGEAEAIWQLTGLDYGLMPADGAQPGDPPTLRFRMTARNPTALVNTGNLYIIPRRHDFHAIGGVSCVIRSVGPGQEAKCSGPLGTHRGYAAADVRFVTVELGGGIGRPPTPLPLAPATPCPPRATPAPAPPLADVVGRVWLPRLTSTRAELCP